MNNSSQTMRIDIPPDLKEEMRISGKKRGAMPPQEPIASPPEPTSSLSSIGDTDFQQLFQSAYDGAIITDLKGKIVDANSRVMSFLQYPRLKLLTLSLIEIISGANDSTLATLLTGIEKDRFILIQAYCVRHDNTLFPCEIAVNRLHVRGKEYLCCFIRDISWRRQAEEMLRTVHTAIQNSATGIAIADLNAQIDYINLAGARLWGRRKMESLINVNLRDLIKDHESVNAMILAVKHGESWSSKLDLTSDTAPTIHVQMAVAPNRDTDENLIGMVISFLDVSDRIRANEAEQQADRQRVMVESLGAACHHLGQPATVLLTSLELLSRIRLTDKPLADELLASSLEAAESLRKLLHSLNDITEYRTTPYIEGHSNSGLPESRILDVNVARN